MGSVVADGEEVVFNDGTPSSPRDIFDLVSHALGEQRKAIVSFEVDGTDVLQTGNFPETFEAVIIKSLVHDEIILRISIQLLNQLGESIAHLKAYQSNILSVAWSEVFKQMDGFISKIQPFADLIDNVSPYVQSYNPPWGNQFTEIAQVQANCLNLVLGAFEQKNPARLSEIINTELIPVIEDTHKLFGESAIPSLKELVLANNPNWQNDA